MDVRAARSIGSSWFFPQRKERLGATVKKFIATLLVGAVLFTGLVSVTGCSGETKDAKPKDKVADKDKK